MTKTKTGTMITLITLFVLAIFAALADAQSQSPYDLPAMDRCEPIQNPYTNAPMPTPLCNTKIEGARTFDFATGWTGQIEATSFVAYVVMINKRDVEQRVIVEFYIGRETRKMGIVLGPKERFPLDVQDRVLYLVPPGVFGLSVTFLDGEGAASVEIWTGGAPYVGNLLLPVPIESVYRTPTLTPPLTPDSPFNPYRLPE